MGALSALVSAGLSGLTPVILKRTAESETPLVINFLKIASGFVFTTLVMLVFDPGWLGRLSWSQLGLGALAALMGPVLAWFFYIKAIALMDVSLVSPGSNSYPLLAIGIDFLVYGVVPSWLALIAAGAILGGLWFLSVDSPKSAGVKKAWVFVFVTAACWAINNVLFKTLVISAGVLAATWLRVFFALVFLGVMVAVFYRKQLRSFKRSHLLPVLAAGVTHDFGVAFFFIAALRISPIYIASPISATSPLFAALLSGRFLREKVSAWRWAGVLLIVAGIVAMSLSTR